MSNVPKEKTSLQESGMYLCIFLKDELNTFVLLVDYSSVSYSRIIKKY